MPEEVRETTSLSLPTTNPDPLAHQTLMSAGTTGSTDAPPAAAAAAEIQPSNEADLLGNLFGAQRAPAAAGEVQNHPESSCCGADFSPISRGLRACVRACVRAELQYCNDTAVNELEVFVPVGGGHAC